MKWIKKFDEKMTDDVMDIWLSTNQEAHDFIPNKYWEKNYKNMRKALTEELNVYVYNANGVVKGFVVMMDDAHIAGVYVDRAYRREGIGSKLLQCGGNAVRRHAARLSYSSVFTAANAMIRQYPDGSYS